MKCSLFFLISLVLCICSCREETSRDSFKLNYLFAGLGSNYNTLQPVFNTSGNRYEYLLKENSTFTGEYHLKPETLSVGTIRNSSIDSILTIISSTNDSLIERWNHGIFSGGIHFLTIEGESKSLSFELHNAYHPMAKEIIDVLNTNLPSSVRPLYLIDHNSPN